MSRANNNTVMISVSLKKNKQILKNFPGVLHANTHSGSIFRTTPGALRLLAIFLSTSVSTRLTTLADIAVTDRVGVKGRFVVKYFFLSTQYSSQQTVQLYVNEVIAVPSLSVQLFTNKAIFASAGWLEREA